MPSAVRSRENVAFTEVIRTLRLKKKLEQTELAARCGRKRWWVVKLETGRRVVTLPDVRALAHGLEIKEDVLFRKYLAWRDAR